jgi:hypothetical protein
VHDDYPLQPRRSGRKKYFVALVVLGAVGLAWVLIQAGSFLALRMRSTISAGIVTGYEFVGGATRLRVQTTVDGMPGGFMLLQASGWPRYTRGQRVQVLTWRDTNQLGQQVQRSMAYAHRNHWQKPGVVLALALVAMVTGANGLRRSR